MIVHAHHTTALTNLNTVLGLIYLIIALQCCVFETFARTSVTHHRIQSTY
jgi:hypothetical protein